MLTICYRPCILKTIDVLQHPGGEEVLMNLSGKDATQCFDEIGHSDEAKQLCESYKIGQLVEVTI